MSLFQVTLIALAISLLGNLWLFDSRDTAIKKAAIEHQTAQTNLESAKLCSAGVDKLQADQKARDELRSKDRAIAGVQADGKQAEGMKILATPPSAPGDECKSTTDLLTNWHRSRTQK